MYHSWGPQLTLIPTELGGQLCSRCSWYLVPQALDLLDSSMAVVDSSILGQQPTSRWAQDFLSGPGLPPQLLKGLSSRLQVQFRCVEEMMGAKPIKDQRVNDPASLPHGGWSNLEGCSACSSEVPRRTKPQLPSAVTRHQHTFY